MRLLPALSLPFLLAAASSVGCGTLYYDGYDGYDEQVVEPAGEAPGEEGQEVEEAPIDGEEAPAEGEEAVATGEDAPSVEVFYDALDDYGVWQQDPDYGYVFAPSADDYVPYTDGYWVQTEYGQTWVAEDPIGWAVCHYGRWFYRDRWLWLPGTEWGPAWVEWRTGGGYVGWAPLTFGGYPVPYYSWRFVHGDHFHARGLRSHYRRMHEVRSLYPYTARVERYVRGRNGQRYVAGPAHVPGASSPPPARLRDLPARETGRFAGRAGAGRRSEEHGARESYRASRARAERMSRAGLDPTPTRRYEVPSRPQRDRATPPASYRGERRRDGASGPDASRARRDGGARYRASEPERRGGRSESYRGASERRDSYRGARQGSPRAGVPSPTPSRAPAASRPSERRDSGRASAPSRGGRGSSPAPSRGGGGRRGR